MGKPRPARSSRGRKAKPKPSPFEAAPLGRTKNQDLHRGPTALTETERGRIKTPGKGG